MSILQKSFEGVRGKAISGGLAALMTLASAGPIVAQELASIDQGQQAAVPTQIFDGKPVILRVGPNFSWSAAHGIADVLNDEGCPTTVTTERGFPKHVTVETDGKKFMFTEIGSAGASALDWCLGKS